MSNLFYIDNDTITRTDTTIIAGNSVSNIFSSTNAIGIHAETLTIAILRDNKVSRIRSPVASIGILCDYIDDINMSHNTISRAASGLVTANSNYQQVYNLTIHDCETCIETDVNGVFRNIALSSYKDNVVFRNNYGFSIVGTTVIDVDYLAYYGIGTIFNVTGGGSYTLGSKVYDEKIIYMDEPSDDLTPDHISHLIKTGVNEPRLYLNPSIGGIYSDIQNEATAVINYKYDLLDNSFWDIDNDESGEMSLIKACQSRILANSEAAEQQVERDYYIKTASSTARFNEVYPIHARYHTPSRYKKAVMDMWYGGQNACTLPSYNRGIGGYHYYTSFFKRALEYDDSWIIGVSYVGYNNYLLGYDAMKYGIVIDVLGVSTLTTEASAECYLNVQNSISDVSPVLWNLHNEVEPDGYLVFANFYNDYEYCTLSNMVYNEDFYISTYEETVSGGGGEILTPLIPTATIHASGHPSGSAELSTFDRINSETVDRSMFYRIGPGIGTMGSWIEIARPIGEYIHWGSEPYIQFKITVDNTIRDIDYEFVGLALKQSTETEFISGGYMDTGTIPD